MAESRLHECIDTKERRYTYFGINFRNKIFRFFFFFLSVVFIWIVSNGISKYQKIRFFAYSVCSIEICRSNHNVLFYLIRVYQWNGFTKIKFLFFYLHLQRGSDELLSQAVVMAPASDNNNQDLATKKAKLDSTSTVLGGVGKLKTQ